MKTLTFEELDRLSIRTGCETETNRAADLELRRRGYVFNASEQQWIKPAPDPVRGTPHWLPIESAPKDGTRMLLFDPRGFVIEGNWSRGDSFVMPHWSTMTDTFEPTHWMPLPDPPLVSGKQEEPTK